MLGEDLAKEEFVCASDELKKETSIYLLITHQNDASTGVLSAIRNSKNNNSNDNSDQNENNNNENDDNNNNNNDNNS